MTEKHQADLERIRKRASEEAEAQRRYGGTPRSWLLVRSLQQFQSLAQSFV